MTLVRMLRSSEQVRAEPGQELELDGAVARRLIEAGDAERVIIRSSEPERAVKRA